MRSAVYHTLGVMLGLFSTSMLPPIVVSLIYDDKQLMPFVIAFGLILGLGLLLWLPTRHRDRELRFRDGFLIVVLFWTVLSGVGAVPLMLLETPSLSIIDALFESMSGLTTTGATILSGIDELPPSILYYRQQLQWLGGMGIIVLAVAVMPILGIGGMQLYRAETPGPMKQNKLAGRVAETAKKLWYVYVSLTVVCMICYWLAGMSIFDALCHAYSTVAIGGFSTHDASLAWFDSNAVNLVAGFFMVLSGMNFALHYTAFNSRRLQAYLEDPEASAYLVILFGISLLSMLVLFQYHHFPSWSDTLIDGTVQVISVVTTTGFITSEYHLWPSFLPVLLILMSSVGGCAGSTAGGMKVIRVLLLFRQGARETTQLVHPNAVVSIKVGGKRVQENIINAVWGFFALYVLSYVVLLVALMATGSDHVTAFSAVTACLNNMGPGLADVGQNYASVEDGGKIVLIVAMLLGRLELFTLIVLFSPAYWR